MIERIKEFFRIFLKINNQKCISAPKEVAEPIINIKMKNDNDFKDRIIVNNKEEDRILKLQRDFKAGLINEEDLSADEFNLLSNLYEKQIEQTKQSIQRYKKKIMIMRSPQNNTNI